MTQIYFDPIVPGQQNGVDSVNNPLGQLDSVIYQHYHAFLDALNAAVLEAGTSDAETITARTAISYLAGTPPATLSATLGYLDGAIANVMAYGADNTGAANSATAIAAALAARDTVYLAPGTYLLSSGLTVGSNKYIFGRDATIQTASGGFVTLAGDNITIEGVNFVGYAASHVTQGDGGSAIVINCTANRKDIFIRNCTFRLFGTALNFNGPASVDPTILIKGVTIDKCTFRDINDHIASFQKGGASRLTNYTVQYFRFTNNICEDVYYTNGFVYGGGIYISGGITLKDMTVANCQARNIHTAFITCSAEGYIDRGVVANCNISGLPDTGTTIHHRMGMEFSGTKNLTVVGCNIEYVLEECLTFFGSQNFSVVGCNFRAGNMGIACYDPGDALAGSSGTIAACTFMDMEDPSGTKTARYGIFLAELEHRVKITGCTFEKGTASVGTGIRLETVAHPYTVITGCNFRALPRGIWCATTLDHRITIEACVFDGCTTAGIQATNLVDSVIANCRFTSCAIDITVSTSSYVRCTGNMHNASTIAIQLQNATWNTVLNSVFRNVGTVHDGNNKIGVSNRVLWNSNNYVGTTTAPPANQGYTQIMMLDGTIHIGATASPTTGTWNTGDIAWNRSPTAGGNAGWICVSGGTSGTWKSFGTIAA